MFQESYAQSAYKILDFGDISAGRYGRIPTAQNEPLDKHSIGDEICNGLKSKSRKC